MVSLREKPILHKRKLRPRGMNQVAGRWKAVWTRNSGILDPQSVV